MYLSFLLILALFWIIIGYNIALSFKNHNFYTKKTCKNSKIRVPIYRHQTSENFRLFTAYVWAQKIAKNDKIWVRIYMQQMNSNLSFVLCLWISTKKNRKYNFFSYLHLISKLWAYFQFVKQNNIIWKRESQKLCCKI